MPGVSCQACREQERAGDGQPPCRRGEGCEPDERWRALTPRGRQAWGMWQEARAAKSLGLMPPTRRPMRPSEAQAVWQLVMALDQALLSDEHKRREAQAKGRRNG